MGTSEQPPLPQQAQNQAKVSHLGYRADGAILFWACELTWHCACSPRRSPSPQSAAPHSHSSSWPAPAQASACRTKCPWAAPTKTTWWATEGRGRWTRSPATKWVADFRQHVKSHWSRAATSGLQSSYLFNNLSTNKLVANLFIFFTFHTLFIAATQVSKSMLSYQQVFFQWGQAVLCSCLF